MNDRQKNPQPETFRSPRRQKQAPTANQDNPLDTPANAIKKTTETGKRHRADIQNTRQKMRRNTSANAKGR
jgi:hypothetical protein